MQKHDSITGIDPRRLATVSQLVKLLGGAVSESAMRAQVWAAEDHTLSDGRQIKANGLASAIIRIGRKVLIDVNAYFAWLESHRLAPLADLDAARAESEKAA